jgi:hypothetical protein
LFLAPRDQKRIAYANALIVEHLGSYIKEKVEFDGMFYRAMVAE